MSDKAIDRLFQGFAIAVLAMLAWTTFRGCVIVQGDQVAVKVGNFNGPASQPAGAASAPDKSVNELLKEILP